MLKLSLDEALELNPVGIFQHRLLIICGFAFMADALEVNLLVFLSTCAGEEWNLSNEQKASIGGVVFGGILVGNLFWGVFADRYGRKLTFILACSLISISGFLSGMATSYYWLISFRALCGFGIGGSSIPFDLLAELLPSSHRGLFLIYIDYFWTVGALLVTAIAWMFLETSGWRTLAFLTAVPVTLTLLFSIFYLPESPRWLLMKGRVVEAEKVVRDAALVNNITMPAFTLSCEERNEHNNGEDASYSDLLRVKAVRDITIPLWVVWFAFGFTYYGLILFVGRLYAESSSTSSNISGGEVTQCSFDYKAMMINSCAEFVGIAVVSCVIDRVGRVNTQKMFYLLSGCDDADCGVLIFTRCWVNSCDCVSQIADCRILSTLLVEH
jgi:putative MFS transporter